VKTVDLFHSITNGFHVIPAVLGFWWDRVGHPLIFCCVCLCPVYCVHNVVNFFVLSILGLPSRFSPTFI